MPTVIIIGFQYDQTNKELLSMVTDVYLVYSFYRDLGYNIYIASDADRVKVSSEFTRLVVDGIVDESYLTFVNEVFIPTRKRISSREDMEAFFDKVRIEEDSRLIVYYTGHGEIGGLLLPEHSVYPMKEFRNAILNIYIEEDKKIRVSGQNITIEQDEKKIRLKENPNAEILILMDCCNSNGFYLPFKLQADSFVEQSYIYVVPKIILLASSDVETPTIAHHSESPFTRTLITLLRDSKKNLHLKNVIKELPSESTVYASYPSLFVLWSWIFTSEIDIRVDNSMDALLISR